MLFQISNINFIKIFKNLSVLLKRYSKVYTKLFLKILYILFFDASLYNHSTSDEKTLNINRTLPL